jgi:hypothetical protein
MDQTSGGSSLLQGASEFDLQERCPRCRAVEYRVGQRHLKTKLLSNLDLISGLI